MNKRYLQWFFLLLASCAGAVYLLSAKSSALRVTAAEVAAQRTFINENCVACHNDKAKTADISLDNVDYDNVGRSGDVWEKVLRKVRTGQMPPANLPQPAAATVKSFVTWLETSLDAAAKASPNPGRPAAHRLNRAEYSNAIRDLLALDIKPGMALPVDDSGYGFDNIGEVLTLSPALLEKYMSAARRISRLALGDLTIKQTEERFAPPRVTRSERISDDLPFGSRGGMSFQYYFPHDAEYQLRIKTPGENARYFEMRLPVKAGLHTVGVTFPREGAKAEPGMPAIGRRPQGPPMGGGANVPMDMRLDGARIKRFDVSENMTIDLFIINGPFSPTGRGSTASRDKIFICRPTNASEETPCAKKILTNLARHAFRRTVTTADVNPLFAFYEDGRKNGDFDSGIQSALEALLISPDFLFRIERDPRTTTSQAYRVNDFELASRLSFFLWSSIPDDELLTLAEQGKLKDAAVLQQQVRRMLDDPKSAAFVSNFGGQWLYLRNLDTITPDPDLFPTVDDGMKRSFRRETELFFDSILRENRSIFDLLSADYTFLNQRLAEHYGVSGVYGSQFRRVQLHDPNRGGLLGQGSILTVTSYPNRTSVVQRGKWILENLLGAPPPPPPPDVPDLKPHGKDGKLLSMREQMDLHRTNPICASCHSRMDPIGFALENYDAVGRWRTKDAGHVIDASGKLPNGTKFSGPNELKKILLTTNRDEFVATVTEKLLTYALGRGLEYYDSPTVRSIMRETAPENYRLPSLISAIVKSTPFQMRKQASESRTP
ncbi:MAG: DUF1592 domain-containing protein [Blastocatellia bacterium]